MKNWTSIAKGVAPDIPAPEVAQIAGTLNALDEIFHPLAQKLTPEMEPAAIFCADEEPE